MFKLEALASMYVARNSFASSKLAVSFIVSSVQGAVFGTVLTVMLKIFKAMPPLDVLPVGIVFTVHALTGPL